MVIIISLITLGVVSLLILTFIFFPHFFGALWYPTPKRKIRKMLFMAKLKEGELVYDLGCGDGRVLIIAAKEFKAKAVGIDIDPLKIFFVKLRLKLLNLLNRNIKLIQGNLFHYSLNEADVVTIYLTQETNGKLAFKLFDELKKDARVVSHKFPLHGHFELINFDQNDKIYVYKPLILSYN
ncbi:methyltransferase domain-containing protein [bacterium]|nr:methyltransferase domain-containing protein [bacterium]MBU1153725.1 methyltransferase domain-containing protein [bacterium]MBU2599543.1 methyltransferase domain-containing protein [bacterium]